MLLYGVYRGSLWYSQGGAAGAGSWRMGIDDTAAVAAGSTHVHGLDGLRVVDASIMPTLIGGDTRAPTAMIAQKAADLILGQTAP